MKKLIYILGNSYSGSTLLDLYMGSQPKFRSLGEVHRITSTQAERLQVFGNRCSCGQRLHDCSYWESAREHVMKNMGFRHDSDWSELPFVSPRQFYLSKGDVFTGMIDKLESKLRYFLSRPPGRLALEQGEQQWYFFTSLAEHFDVDFLVDSSKSISPLLKLAHSRPDSIVVVRLIRDGRGVMNSVLKRSDPTIDPASVVKKWRKESSRYDKVVERLGVNSVVINYEAFCASPEETLRVLTHQISGIEAAESSRVTKEISNHHIIPGNPMSNKEHITIEIDDSWRRELSQESLEVFDRHGAALNLKYGYTDN